MVNLGGCSGRFQQARDDNQEDGGTMIRAGIAADTPIGAYKVGEGVKQTRDTYCVFLNSSLIK